MAASSPRFKSKRRSEGPDIFKGVEKRRSQKNIEEASSEFKEANSKIEEALAFSKVGLAQKPRATSTLDGAQNLKRQAQKSESHLFFQTCQHLSHACSTFWKSQAVCRSADSRYRRGICFIQTCQHLSHAHSALRKLRGNLSKISGEVENT
ncbi:hypothetical protein ACFXTN_019077 [Malus domestica]